MTRHRFVLFGLLLTTVFLAAAGCGGGEEEGEGGATGTAANISGSVTLLADWTGPEGQSIDAVMDAFKEKYPNIDAKYRPSTNIAQDLSTAVEGGNPPDLAAVPNPGLTADYQSRGVLKPIEFARSTVEENFSQDWVDLGSIDGQLYGVFFKGANKSIVWYNVHVFDDAGVEPPTSWDELLQTAQTIKASGVPAWSIDASDGWPLTDLFEIIYARNAGPDKYRQLTQHEIPWTDQSVIDALTMMNEIYKDSDNIVGGTDGALQTDFPTSVSNVFASAPKGGMIVEGDFVPGVVAGQTPAKPETDFNFFDFPGEDTDVVVGGGNEVIMFNDTPAARALVEFLASPEAGEVWAARGGFSSPNKNVGEDVYPDEITKRAATSLANAGTFLFDMSDLMPAEFGSDAEFTILQDFFANHDVEGTAQKLEDAAAKAFK